MRYIIQHREKSNRIKIGTPNGIRIRVAGLKGRCPRPLDDGGTGEEYIKNAPASQFCDFHLLPVLK